MTLLRIILTFIVSAACFSSLLAQEGTGNLTEPISGDVMVEVGDPGNEPYLRKDYEFWGTPVKLGSVDHVYKIGKYEVTIQDWQTFLAATASQPNINGVIDAYGLWNEGMVNWIQPWDDFSQDGKYIRTYNIKDKTSIPITQVSLYSVFFYINWKEHGSPILEAGADVGAILKHGAYEILEDGTIIPNEKSHFYLPSHDEWIKAAYYTSNKLGGWYSLYPTQHDTAPGNNNGDVTNQANYNSRSWLSSSLLALTPVDYFSESKSYYGCYDMGGNVNEWTYTLDGPDKFIVRGGSYESQYNYSGSNDLMINAISKSYDPSKESATISFRIAERDCSNEETASQKNIPTDVINKIKEHGVGWSSAEVYDGYVVGKNIYYCSQPEKIIKTYKYAKTGMKELMEQDPARELALPPSDQTEIATCTLEINPRDISLKRGIGVIGAERHIGNTPEGIWKAMRADYHPEEFCPSELAILKENFWLPTGAIEIPKQLIVGGIAGLAIGAGCEFSGKYSVLNR